MRIMMLEPGEADAADIIAADLATLPASHAADLEPEFDVAEHRSPRHQGVILEHETAIVAWSPHRAALAGDAARILLGQAGHDAKHRRLAAAAGPQKTHERVGWDED